MKSLRIGGALALLLSGAACSTADTQAQQTSAALYGDYLIGRYADLQRIDGDATTRYMSALRLAPNDETLLKGAVESALAAGDIPRAQMAAQMAQKQNVQSELARLTLATLAVREGRYKAAAGLVTGMAGGAFDRAAAQLLLAWAQAGDGKIDDALVTMSAGRVDSAFTRMSTGQTALVLDNAGRTDAALAAYARADQNGFRSSALVIRHGALLERAGREDEAAALYRMILSGTTDDPSARAALARLEAGGKPSPAPTIAEGAALSLFTLAGGLVGQIDVDYYLPYLTLARVLDPKLESAWLVSGEALRQIGKSEEARAALGQVGASSPWYEVAQTRIAWSYREEDKIAEALNVAQALATQTQGRLARVTLGDIQRAAAQWAQAEAVYDQLIADSQPAQPADWTLYFARAACREELGRWAEAEADLKRALALSPNQPEAMNFLGYSWVSKGVNLNEGLALLEKAVAMRPESGYIIDSLGWAHFQLSNFTAAVEALERAVALDPQDPTLNDHLGDAYWRVGRRIEARFQWTRALSQKPEEKEKAALEQKLKAGLSALPPRAPH